MIAKLWRRAPRPLTRWERMDDHARARWLAALHPIVSEPVGRVDQ